MMQHHQVLTYPPPPITNERIVTVCFEDGRHTEFLADSLELLHEKACFDAQRDIYLYRKRPNTYSALSDSDVWRHLPQNEIIYAFNFERVHSPASTPSSIPEILWSPQSDSYSNPSTYEMSSPPPFHTETLNPDSVASESAPDLHSHFRGRSTDKVRRVQTERDVRAAATGKSSPQLSRPSSSTSSRGLREDLRSISQLPLSAFAYHRPPKSSPFSQSMSPTSSISSFSSSEHNDLPYNHFEHTPPTSPGYSSFEVALYPHASGYQTPSPLPSPPESRRPSTAGIEGPTSPTSWALPDILKTHPSFGEAMWTNEAPESTDMYPESIMTVFEKGQEVDVVPTPNQVARRSLEAPPPTVSWLEHVADKGNISSDISLSPMITDSATPRQKKVVVSAKSEQNLKTRSSRSAMRVVDEREVALSGPERMKAAGASFVWPERLAPLGTTLAFDTLESKISKAKTSADLRKRFNMEAVMEKVAELAVSEPLTPISTPSATVATGTCARQAETFVGKPVRKTSSTDLTKSIRAPPSPSVKREPSLGRKRGASTLASEALVRTVKV